MGGQEPQISRRGGDSGSAQTSRPKAWATHAPDFEPSVRTPAVDPLRRNQLPDDACQIHDHNSTIIDTGEEADWKINKPIRQGDHLEALQQPWVWGSPRSKLKRVAESATEGEGNSTILNSAATLSPPVDVSFIAAFGPPRNGNPKQPRRPASAIDGSVSRINAGGTLCFAVRMRCSSAVLQA